jgi:hypothetical protein
MTLGNFFNSPIVGINVLLSGGPGIAADNQRQTKATGRGQSNVTQFGDSYHLV